MTLGGIGPRLVCVKGSSIMMTGKSPIRVTEYLRPASLGSIFDPRVTRKVQTFD